MSGRAGSRGRSPSDSPRPSGPPIPLYLAVVWGPWNWAAVAVSQELLPEAERDETGAEGCSPGWRTEGDTPACPSSPLDQLGPLMASPKPFLLPASWGRFPGDGSQPGALAPVWVGLRLWARNHCSALLLSGPVSHRSRVLLWPRVSLWPRCPPPPLSGNSPSLSLPTPYPVSPSPHGDVAHFVLISKLWGSRDPPAKFL